MTSFATNTPQIAPSANFVTVTPSDSTVVSGVRALIVTVTGDVVAKNIDGTSVTFAAVPIYTRLDISPSRIMAATSATVVALY
jgi:hypothetical protein